MAPHLPLSLVLALAGLLIAVPAAAQDTAQRWAVCENGDRKAPADAVLAACTALLDSGALGPADQGKARFGRATVYRVQRNYQRAVEEYDAALLLTERAIAATAGRPEQAGLIERSANGYFRRGQSIDQLGDIRRGAADFREAMRRAPHQPDYANSLCWNLALLGERLDEARAACDTSLRDRPGHTGTLDSRGMVGLKQQRYQDAWNDYDAAVRIDANGPSWLYGRGIAALRLGRTAAGRADIASAEKLDATITKTYADIGVKP